MNALTIFRGLDWLRELRAVLILGKLVVAITAALGLATALFDRVVYVDVPADYAVNLDAAAPELRRNVRIDEGAWVEVAVSDATSAQIALYLLHDGPPLLLMFAMLVLLHRVVVKARAGQPFTAAISNRLFALGTVLCLGGLLTALVQLVTSWWLLDSLSPLPAFYGEFNPLWWLAGLGFLAVGEIVRRGVDIRTELDQVI